jgi:hypothetical protein
MSRKPRGRTRTVLSSGACACAQDGPACDRKGPGAIRIRPTSAEMLEKSSSMRLVWGPGAGVEAAGRLCPRRKWDRGRKQTLACRQGALV